jgi:hypothetical protein
VCWRCCWLLIPLVLLLLILLLLRLLLHAATRCTPPLAASALYPADVRQLVPPYSR